ncbi:MAG: GUN4 domain-containing protein [Limnoraphis robusta]
MEKLPCSDLYTIDQLWVASSNGHFGCFTQVSVQIRLHNTRETVFHAG